MLSAVFLMNKNNNIIIFVKKYIFHAFQGTNVIKPRLFNMYFVYLILLFYESV